MRKTSPLDALFAAQLQTSNILRCIEGNPMEHYMSGKLWSVYYELDRQIKNLHHQQKTERDNRETG